MPRKWTLTAKSWPGINAGRPYPMQVLDIRKSKEGMLVTLEHFCKSQAGRRHEVVLPLDIYPDNLTARLLRAAGLTVVVGEHVSPAEALGATILVTFEPTRDGGDPEPVAFAPAKEETDAESAESAHAADDTGSGDCGNGV